MPIVPMNTPLLEMAASASCAGIGVMYRKNVSRPAADAHGIDIGEALAKRSMR